ncbi:hypothetical protein [Micavibrio aeruginosavorus]|uniref:hypothetical protein n=1 Tax=Micavibrio aeruginosavorus TaxID=349221 RepID=UPI003F4AB9E7
MIPPTDFESGRRDGFLQIRVLFDIDIGEVASTAVVDFTGPGAKQDVLSPLIQICRRLTKMHMRAVNEALAALESGSSVYALTGQKSIPTYRAIVDGDYNAGMLSAAEDMVVLLATIDTKQVFTPPTLAPNATDGVNPLMDVDFSKICAYNHALLTDTLFMRIHERIIAKTKKPVDIAYDDGMNGDGGNDAPRKRSLSEIFMTLLRNQRHYLDRFGMRRDKMTPCWPPLQGGPAVLAPPTPAQKTIEAPAPITAMDDATLDQPNHSMAYAAGFGFGLKLLYNALQNAHFNALASPRGYADNIGHDSPWGKIIATTATQEFSILRDAIRDRMNDTAAQGPGTSNIDGMKGALHWAQREIDMLKSPTTRDRHIELTDEAWAYVIETIHPFWTKTAQDIVMTMAKDKKPGMEPRP